MKDDLPATVVDLLDPRAHAAPTRQVEMIQTHISYVLLTDSRVYKIKKPVRFPFVDFSTLDQRRLFCGKELTLNRRISPSVYLDVLPIVQTDAGHRFGRDGAAAVEYAVEMRRLPESENAETRLRESTLEPEDLGRIARLLADFHARARRGPDVDAYASSESIARLVRGNLDEIASFADREIPAEPILKARSATDRWLSALSPAFTRRVRERRACDGHGDLQLQHFFVHEPNRSVSVIDCVEFNQSFRCADVAADVAFLAMDLDHQGRPDLSDLFVNRYADVAADHELMEVVDFYKAYRALVRAKVLCLKSREPEVPESDCTAAVARAKRYSALASLYGEPEERARALILVCGPPGAGKTTLAWALSARLGAPVVSSDVVRKALLGMKPTQRGPRGLQQGIYRPEVTRRVYARLLSLASTILRAGRSVILDATYPLRAWRAEASRLARDEKTAFVIVECRADASTVARRLKKRENDPESVSDATRGVARALAARYEPVSTGEAEVVIGAAIDRGADELARGLEEEGLGQFSSLSRRRARIASWKGPAARVPETFS